MTVLTVLTDHLDLLMVAVTFSLLMTGFPVAFVLAGVALAAAGLGWAFGAFNPSFMNFLPQRLFGLMTREVLLAVPLFVFMGVMLQRSRVAEELLEAMGHLLRRAPAGLALAVTVVGALLAASTGIVGATVVTMGLMSLPSMLRHGYDPRLACGTVAAAGTLGQIIPPSIVLVLLGNTLSTAHQSAQMEQGIFAAETVAVGDLFAGALVPGLLLVLFYLAFQGATALLAPSRCPPPAAKGDRNGPATEWSRLILVLGAPISLIVAVLGSILGGIATPTEAAAVGAIGATLLAGARVAPKLQVPIAIGAASWIALAILGAALDLRVGRGGVTSAEAIGITVAAVLCVTGTLGTLAGFEAVRRTAVLGAVARTTGSLTAMIFTIVIGATLFTLVFRGLGGDDTVRALLDAVPGGTNGAVVAVMAAMFFLGFFLDFVEITLLVVPIVGPILLAAGVDPVWLGVMMAINLQTSFLTPPFGFALFYLRGVAPDTVRTGDIYRGALPYVAIQLLTLALVGLVPALATWLPALLYG